MAAQLISKRGAFGNEHSYNRALLEMSVVCIFIYIYIYIYEYLCIHKTPLQVTPSQGPLLYTPCTHRTSSVDAEITTEFPMRFNIPSVARAFVAKFIQVATVGPGAAQRGYGGGVRRESQ